MKKITFILFALLFSFFGYSQFPTPGTEGFENTSGPDLPITNASSPWTLGTGLGTNQWAVFDNGITTGTKRRWDRMIAVTVPPSVYAGNQAAFINRRQNGGAGIISEDYLATPLITVPTSGQLTFWTRLGFNVGDAVNYLIKVNTITTPGSQTTFTNYTNTVQSWNQTNLVATYNIYEQKTVDLSAYAGQQVYLAFVRVFNQPTASLGGNSWYVDDVKIVQQCLAPTNLTATGITQNSANLNWSNPSGSTSWEIEVVPATGTPTGVGTTYSGALPYVATGLTPATGYVYYVRSKCLDSDSAWVGPFNFTTLTPGLNCASAIIIPPTLPSYNTSDTTANYSDTTDTTQPAACAGTATNYMTGNDVFYSYTAATTGAISITMTPQGATATNSSMFVYDGCANVGVTCLAGVANATSNVRNIPSLNVTAGQTYIIVLSSTSATQTYPYNLVIQQLNCAAPSALAVTGTTSTGTQLSWTSPTSASWQYVVQTAGSSIPTGSGTSTSSSTNTPVSGLNPDTAYQYWVRADCGNGTFSAWSGPFLFTTAVAPPACGGQFVDDGGQAGSYSNNANTIYPICPTNAGDQVTVTFTAFNTQLNTDLLKVYDGNGTTGTLLATYSGTTIPGPITSSSLDGCLTFVFTSNGTTNAAGWVANVTCTPAPACQKPILLTTSTVLYNSVQLSWTQPANPDTTVSTAWEILALPCGSSVPTAATSGISVTTNPYTYTGLAPLTCYDFYIRSICSTNSEWVGVATATTPIAPPVCGGNFVDTGGLTGNYANNANYSTPICPTNPGEQVTVTFTAFNTQLNNDILKVYDGNGTTGNLLGSFSGTTIPPAITSSTPDGCLTFVFTSNASTTSSGWLANVTCAPAPPCQKPILLTAPTAGVLYNSVQLSWTQPANPDTFVATAWEVIALPCGSPAPNASPTGVISASTNPFTVTGLSGLTCYDFYVRAVCSSSSSSTWTGPVTASTPIAPTICGGNYVDPGGIAANYANNITAATGTTTVCPTNPGDQVTVTFTAFNTELNNDILKVYSGTGTAGILLGTYSGTTIPQPVTSASPDGCLTFVFTSNGSINSTGWVSSVTCAPAPACQKPVVINTPSVQSTTVTLSWTQPANASSWEVLALPCGSPAPSATPAGVIVAGTNPFIVTGLSASTCYDFYVRAVCSSTSSSSWSGPKTATTTPCDNACNYIFTVSDTFGDGWNGNTMSVIQNGITVATLTGPTDAQNSTPIPVSVTLCPGVFQLFWNAGGTFATEVGVTITSFLGEVIFTHTPGTNLQNTLLFSDTTICTPPTCPKPNAVIATSTSATSASVSWTESGTATQWEIIYLPQGSPAPLPGATGAIVNTNPAVINGLTVGTFYDVYVRAICSPTDSSLWSNLTSLYINPPLPNCAGVNLNLTTTSPGVLDVCPDNNCVNLSANYTDSRDTSSYNVYSTPYAPPFPFTGGTQVSVNIDDVWSGDLTIPFKFCFYGVSYTSLNIGSNGVVSFNSYPAGPTCPWAFTAQIPNTNFPILNAIYAPYQDINPSITTPPAQPNINYQVLGLAPCRVFVINFSNVAQFSCGVNVGLQTSQLVLYETSNVIDIYIKDRTPCTTWNSGSGVIGIQNAAGTNAVFPPGRNTGTWPATNEAWRFLPTGNSNVTFQWLQDGAPLTTNLTTTVCLTQDTNLTAQATYTACDGTQVIKSENILLNLLTPVTPTFAPIGPLCQGETAPILPTTSNNTTGSISGVWSPSTIDTSLVGTFQYTFTPTVGQCAIPTIMNVTVTNSITPLFNNLAPICIGTPAPILPITSNNSPAITGSWTPAVVSNTASGTYTFNPDPGQCATPTTVQVTVNNSCALGSYASAVWLTNCATSNFFNTVGSGADLIGPAANLFANTDFGTYIQNSNNFILRGAEVKTFKSASSNFCSARLNYRVYPVATTPGAFQIMDLPWFEDCTAGNFPSGGPCNPLDQKWQRVVANGTTTPYAPVNLTAYPPGNYVLQVYYDLTGSDSSATGCTQNFLVDNNGAYYTATFTIQAQPSYTSANPTTCGGANGSITISGLEPSTIYGVSYQQGTTAIGPLNLTSDASGQITIAGLTSGTYSNFSITLNNCVYPYSTPIVLVDPVVPTVTVNSPTECSGTLATVTATPGSAASYSYAWTCPSGVANPGDVATFTTSVAGVYSVIITNTVTGCSSTSASGAVTINPINTPTFNAIAPLCTGSVAPILPTTSTNIPTSISGTWSPSVVSNTASGTYTFTPDAGQCSQPVSLNVIVNSVSAPVISILTQPTCAVQTGSIEVTSPLSVTVGGVVPTDIFISEVTDSNFGPLSYIELYNGTSASINLSNYSLKTANSTSSYNFTLPLNNVNIASGASYVVALGTGGASICNTIIGGDGSFGAQSSGSGSVNFNANGNDHYGLFNGTTLIDSWGEFGNDNWAPSNIGDQGADFRRKNNVGPLPNPSFNNNDWDVLDYVGSGQSDCANNDYSNIGIYSINSSTTNYQYNVDGGAYQTSPIFTGLTPGVHNITVQDMLTGCISEITSVTINNPPTSPTVTVNSPTECGVNATVTATPGAAGTYTYVWTVPSGATNPGNVNTFVTTTSGSYSVVITDTVTGCFSTSASGTVTINAIPTVTVNSPTNCGVSALVTAAPGAAGTYTYTWTVPSGANPGNVASFNATVSGAYTVTVTNASGCTSLPANSTVTINPNPTVTVNSPSVCGVNATVTATPGTVGTYSYVWTVPAGVTNPGNVNTFVTSASGSYSVIITDTVTGCFSTSASGTVTINAIPTVTVNSPTNCGVSALVTAAPGAAGTYTYAWTVPAGSANPGSVASFNATVSGTYSVVITNTTTGCVSASASGGATINALPTVSVNSSVVCNGQSASVTATPGSAGTYSYAWTAPAGAVNPGNVASFTSTVAGTYSVIITNTSTGCISSSASGTIAFVPSFDYSVVGECISNNFTLLVIPSGNSFDLNSSTFNWTINSVTVGSNATFNATAYFNDPMVTTQIPATFNVNVTTVDGCQLSDSILVDRIYCDIQKGISPNNDNKNDFFDLRLMGVQQLGIYNRYGTKVYSKNEYTNEWIGQSDSGSELPDGTYYYVIEFKNNQPSKTGWIYINRNSK
ncbi:fibronectin type III domain-containing protein [Flavobacterium sp.]|jgi:gliding motility-associated-like protein|uniref:fibronectin type III domain-containing protein n=1 Tax=Flavobacterium sp. TaxID=239 RepID=UPI0037C08823